MRVSFLKLIYHVVKDSNTESLKKTEIHDYPAPSNPTKSQYPSPFKKSLPSPETDTNEKATKKVID